MVGSICDIVLIQPECCEHGYDGVYTSGLPLGLGYIAAVLEDAGFRVMVFDGNCGLGGFNNIVRVIQALRPPVVAVSVNTPSLPWVYRLTRRLREGGFASNFVFGGPHVTAHPIVVGYLGGFGLMGDGERGIVELCNFLVRGIGSLGKVPNLVEVSNRGLKCNVREFVGDLDCLPSPARHLFEVGRYDFMHIMCSRGCPYKCMYCSMSCSGYRSRTPENVADEFVWLSKNYPNTSICFGDDVFTLDRDWVWELCNIISKKNINARWSCTTRADLVDRQIIDILHGAGCWHISFGIESGIESIRYKIGKRISNEQYRRVFSVCRKVGIKTRAYAMFGHPGEGVEDMLKTLHFIKELRPDDVSISLTSIYPGTGIADIAMKEGRISENVWEENMINGGYAPLYIPYGVKMGDMIDLLKKVTNILYTRHENTSKHPLMHPYLGDIRKMLDLFNGFISNH